MTGPWTQTLSPNNIKKRGADCINAPNQTPHLHLATLKYLSRLMPPLFSLKQNSLHSSHKPHFRADFLQHSPQNTKQPPAPNPRRVLASKRTQNTFQEANVFQRCRRMSWKMYLPFLFPQWLPCCIIISSEKVLTGEMWQKKRASDHVVKRRIQKKWANGAKSLETEQKAKTLWVPLVRGKLCIPYYVLLDLIFWVCKTLASVKWWLKR